MSAPWIILATLGAAATATLFYLNGRLVRQNSQLLEMVDAQQEQIALWEPMVIEYAQTMEQRARQAVTN
jgi:hypothetical protein